MTVPATERHPVEVLVCGSPDRGDDGAPAVATASLAGHLPSTVQVRVIGQLDIDDLLSVPPGARVIVVDAATGIPRVGSWTCRSTAWSTVTTGCGRARRTPSASPR